LLPYVLATSFSAAASHTRFCPHNFFSPAFRWFGQLVFDSLLALFFPRSWLDDNSAASSTSNKALSDSPRVPVLHPFPLCLVQRPYEAELPETCHGPEPAPFPGYSLLPRTRRKDLFGEIGPERAPWRGPAGQFPFMKPKATCSPYLLVSSRFPPGYVQKLFEMDSGSPISVPPTVWILPCRIRPPQTYPDFPIVLGDFRLASLVVIWRF